MAITQAPPLVDQLTLEEQVFLLAGESFWQVGAIDRLGVSAIKVSDGPNGARGAGSFTSGVPAAAFPVGISLASTWNVDLAARIGRALAEEAISKGAHVILGPTVNLHRSPLGGRNFESYSEDPILAGRIGAAIVTGLQELGIAGSLKHFAGNESEFERFTIESRIDERTLRELYLRPFEIVVREAKPWTVMCAYNKLNGVYASENHRLLTEILRNEWGFDGLVMSDWTATHSTAEAVNAGLDLEMPGPTKERGTKLIEAAERGEAYRSAIRASAARVLQLGERTGARERPATGNEQAIDRPEHRALIREAGAQGIVLLKNSGLLPIDPATTRSVAVVGPNAAVAQIMGGGSSQINAHYRVSPLAGIDNAVGNMLDVGAAVGCANTRLLPLVTNPVKVEFFGNVDFQGAPVLTQSSASADFLWLGHIDPAVPFDSFSVRLTTEFRPDRSGPFEAGVFSSGPVRVLIDGQVVVNFWDDWQIGGEFFGLASPEARGPIDLFAGRTYRVVVENRTPEVGLGIGLKTLRLGLGRETADHELDEAVALAANSDVAVVFVGLSGEWDTEGMDRPNMELPGRQNELVARVAAANPNTVVVLQTGGPVTLPWLDDVAAVMEAWYPGQEAGNAIADVLFGRTNPSGKLPASWPALLEQNPSHNFYPGDRGAVRYGEGIFCGYRYYDRTKVGPLFPFGHGLSYISFGYGAVRVSAESVHPGGSIAAAIDVTNTGSVSGSEVVQLYIADPFSTLPRPEKELKGFTRIDLEPDQTGTAEFELDMRSFAFFDDLRDAWVAEAGEFEILIGASSRDIRSTATINLTGDWVESIKDTWLSAHR